MRQNEHLVEWIDRVTDATQRLHACIVEGSDATRDVEVATHALLACGQMLTVLHSLVLSAVTSAVVINREKIADSSRYVDQSASVAEAIGTPEAALCRRQKMGRSS